MNLYTEKVYLHYKKYQRTLDIYRHHPWCNYFIKPSKSCKMCKGLFEKYPQDSSIDMMTKYFPNNIKRT